MGKLYLFIIAICLSQISHASGTHVINEMLSAYGCRTNGYVCKAINDNIERDSNRCMLVPEHIEYLGSYIQKNNPKITQISIADSIRYFGPVRGKYFYKYQKRSAHKFILTAKMHFRNLNEFTNYEISSLEKKFKEAANIWNKYSPYGDTYIFDFQISPASSNQTISARLQRKYTRGPYFEKWSTVWDAYTIAHEFGHVMGLFDEYDYLNQSPSVCDTGSIMCSSYSGIPRQYHYHLIHQRAFCEV